MHRNKTKTGLLSEITKVFHLICQNAKTLQQATDRLAYVHMYMVSIKYTPCWPFVRLFVANRKSFKRHRRAKL